MRYDKKTSAFYAIFDAAEQRPAHLLTKIIKDKADNAPGKALDSASDVKFRNSRSSALYSQYLKHSQTIHLKFFLMCMCRSGCVFKGAS